LKVYGHRGAGGEAPENTLAAFRHAIERGVRYLDMDLRLSADNKMVVIHDKRVDRTTYDSGPVSRFTAREQAAMDARRSAPPWPRKREAGIPTLDRVLEKTPEAKGYYLEVQGGLACGDEENGKAAGQALSHLAKGQEGGGHVHEEGAARGTA